MHGGRVRVLIVDDHEMVREGLKVLLTRNPVIDVVGEAATGAEALDQVGTLQPDVVLMDLTMPVMDGAVATARIRDGHPAVQVVLLSGAADNCLVHQALEAGAISFIVKDTQHDALAQTVIDAAHGRGHVDSSIVPFILDHSGCGPGGDLTPREREVLSLLVEGLSNAEIGRRLQVSTGTVRLHVGNLLAKLEAPNRTAAAVLAVENALV
jgi:two-component system, NarL family, response regulator LiaR